MNAELATEILNRRRQVIPELLQKNTSSPEFTKWRRDTEIAIEKIFSVGARNLHDFKNITYISFASISGDDSDVRHAYAQGLARANAVLESMIDEIKDFGITTGVDAIGAPDVLNLIERLCLKFHLTARTLRDRHGDRPTIEIDDEFDVQDLLHAVLRLHFEDIRPEEWTPSYAGSSSRMDFLLKDEKVVIEVKKTRASLNAKKLGEELIIDCARYEHHPDCDTLFCFVYDPEGRIGNPAGMERDLEKHSGRLKVRVIIAPK